MELRVDNNTGSIIKPPESVVPHSTEFGQNSKFFVAATAEESQFRKNLFIALKMRSGQFIIVREMRVWVEDVELPEWVYEFRLWIVQK